MRGSQDYKAIRYHKLPFLMLQAIKELKASNDRLAAENEALKQQVNADQKRLATLERAFLRRR